MGNGKSKGDQSVIDDHDRAMLDLKNARDTIVQYQKRLTVNCEREKEVAKQLLKQGNKQGALFCIKKKKMQVKGRRRKEHFFFLFFSPFFYCRWR
jgi:charged multivesicular body protein 6